MSDKYIGFVDAGVLRSQRRGNFRPRGQEVVRWFRDMESSHLVGEKFLRLYWYDGAYEASHDQHPAQMKFFHSIERTPGIQLRLGHLVERSGHQIQKGVDTLLTLDLVRLAGRSAFSTAILVVNDRDFAGAITAAQDFGVRVLIATPSQQTVAEELTRLADDVIFISKGELTKMLPLRT